MEHFHNLVTSPQDKGPRFRISLYRKILKRGPYFADLKVMILEKVRKVHVVREVRVFDLALFQVLFLGINYHASNMVGDAGSHLIW